MHGGQIRIADCKTQFRDLGYTRAYNCQSSPGSGAHMLRVITVLLVLAASTITDAADNSYAFMELRNEMSAAKTLLEQRAIIERMREMLRNGAVPGRQASTMIFGLGQKPVLNEAATISFLQELIATPGTADAATTAIAGFFRGNALSEHARDTFAEELLTYHRQQGLSDAAIIKLQLAFTLDTPQRNREYALEILMLRPPDGDKRSKFFSAVSYLLNPEMSVDEKRAAMEIFVKAAETGPLPRHANTAIYKAAIADPDAAVRVAAWPLVMQKRFEQRGSERGRHYFLGADLNKQLIAPLTGSTPSFIDADEATREQAVALLNDYWHPEYHPEYIDILIKLVDMHESDASIKKLLELRRIGALNSDQLTALTEIAAENPAIDQSLETITIPNLEAGSLMGPAQVIANANNSAEWPQATEQLLAQHPDGAVPTSVAEAAYTVMADLGEYDAAAVALFARADMPFATREAKILELVNRTPRHAGQIIKALQHLHGDVGLDFLVRHYASDKSIDESFRATLLNMLYVEVRESGQMDPETTAAVADFARSADGYFSTSIASRILEASGTNVPWSIRVRQEEFQWGLLMWVGLLSLAVGAAAALYLLVLVALPGRMSGLRGTQRVAGIILWLLLIVGFVGATGLSLLHSIGHDWVPPPDQAFPYYAATLAIAIVLLIVAIVLHRQRSPDAHVAIELDGI